METNLKNKYYLVSYEKELADSVKLIESIKKSGWIGKDELFLVNCFPEYSSRLTQIVNHKLSYLNRNELFETVDLHMPYPNMAQVWNSCDKKYQGFYNYMTDWVRSNVFTTSKFLFISAAENLSVLRTFLKVKLEPDDYRTATCYIREGDPEPDFYVEKCKEQIMFQWENMDNPNWKY